MDVVTEKDIVMLMREVFPHLKSQEIFVTLPFAQTDLLTSTDVMQLVFAVGRKFNLSFDVENLDPKKVESPIAIANMVNDMKGWEDMTLRRMFEEICQRGGANPVLVFDEEEWSYDRLHQEVKSLAGGFLSRGIGKGTPVAILMNNRPEYILCYFALFYLGALPVPLNTRWTSGEVFRVLMDSKAKNMVTEMKSGHVSFADVIGEVEEMGCALDRIICVDDMDESRYGERGIAFQEIFSSRPFKPEPISGQDPGMISYTSGTTGSPKGVVLKQVDIAKISAYTTRLWSDEVDKPLSIAPLYSAQGFLSLVINFSLESRFKMLSSFNPNDILKEISKGQETVVHTQPTMWTLLLNSRIINFTNLDALRAVVVSGSWCSPELARQIEEETGCQILNAYGLIEGTSVVTLTRRGDPEEIRLNTVGRPLPGVEIKIVDEKRKPVRLGEVGELAVRGYVMKGYLNQPEKTREIVDEEGWLYTGDLAKYYDKENISIVGRCKDMVVRGGYNVYPSDIEEVIMQMEDVQSTAVIGCPHPVLGEELVAFVVPKAGILPDKYRIARHVFKAIANYKQPDKIYFISEMPIVLAGKIDKKVLRQWAEEGIPEEKKMLFR